MRPLAFFSGERGIVRRRVLRVDRSSGKAEPLDMPVAEYKSVRVSPDGRSIAVNEGPGGGARSDIWIYDLSRRNAIRLTTDQVLSPPIWRPDGKAVITACCDGQFLSIDADGRSAPRKIVKVDNLFGDYAVASITPDGSTLLVVTATGKTRGDILTINLASGSQAHSVFDSAAAEFEPALSPDGRWIAFGTEAEGGNINLQVEPYPSVEPGANFGMGKPYRVLERHEIIENNFGDSRYDVTPDGKAFVMIVEETDKVRPPRLEIVLNSISKIEAVGK
jgi:Tol biopolymer transport system component